MLLSINKLLSNFKGYYQGINCATLTGTMDIIVIEQPDGTLKSTPFHVRFGKVGVFHPSEMKVEISVNNVTIPDLEMRLGLSGEGYFGLASNGSTCNTSTDVRGEIRQGNQNGTCLADRDNVAMSLDFLESADQSVSTVTTSIEEGPIFNISQSISNRKSYDVPNSNLPVTKFLVVQEKLTETVIPQENVTSAVSESSANSKCQDAVIQITSQQTTETTQFSSNTQKVTSKNECKYESSSLDNSICSIRQLPVAGDEVQEFMLSLCGGLDKKHEPSMERFLQHQVGMEEFVRDPVSLLANPNLVVRWDGRFFTWPAISAAMISVLAYQAPLEDSCFARLNLTPGCGKFLSTSSDRPTGTAAAPSSLSPSTTASTRPSRSAAIRSWFWSKSSKFSSNTSTYLEDSSLPCLDVPVNASMDGSYSDSEVNAPPKRHQSISESGSPVLPKANITSALSSSNISTHPNLEDVKQELTETMEAMKESMGEKEKILHLTDEQLKKLNLRPGANQVVFSITTRYQGTSQCSCYIYLWKWTDRLVISDVDGTITRSDVIGNIFGLVGPYWAQSGIAQLYNSINRNGYRIVYVTARAISQSAITRNYLRQLRQDGFGLPDGPILLSPSSLFQAFRREVIEKRPEDFKIRCLSELKSLFPNDHQALYAGFGNRPNDVITYKALNIHLGRIFTVNYQGQLRHELPDNPIVLTYSTLGDVLDEYFPPLLNKSQLQESNSFKGVEEATCLPDESLSNVLITSTNSIVEISMLNNVQSPS